MAQTDSSSQMVYEVHTETNVPVRMRDGIVLMADIHRPARDGRPLDSPFPVLLERTPYNKSTEARVLEAAFFATRGYATVVQDTRGRFASQGGFSKYVNEGEDGFDTVEWIGEQSWCAGKVGTYGTSYAAHTQAALASLNPPHLGCMWLDCGGFSNAFLSGCRNGGAFELRQVTWAYRQALDSPEVQEDPLVLKSALESQSIQDWFRRLPWKPEHSPLKWTPDYESYLIEIWRHETFDDYWKQIGLCAEAHYSEFSDVPQVHMGSWYDPYARSTTDNYVALSAMKKGPVSLIMGPWTHGQRSVTYSGDADFGPQSTLDGNLDEDFNHIRLRFFEHHLKGQGEPADPEYPVKLFIMGGGPGKRNAEGRLDHGGRWREERAWPLKRVRETPFYLLPGGRLSTGTPTEEHGVSTYLFDPNHPVPTVGGNISSGLPIMGAGGFDQRESTEFYGSEPPYLPLASRGDVLVFQTEHLGADVEVTGPLSVKLWVSSTAKDTDFTAKLLDVYPPSSVYPEGYALNLTDGILRAKFRESWDCPKLLEPGEIYQVAIQLFPTSNLFVKGHRIRLDISSSNFPRFDVNGNTGVNPAESAVKLAAQNSVFHATERPSHILLPVVPPES